MNFEIKTKADFLLENCIKNGWSIYEHSSKEDFNYIVNIFGNPITCRGQSGVERLVPRETQETIKPSLSYLYGKGAFPFHSDAAYFFTPPKYLLMYCEINDEDRSSLIIDWEKIIKQNENILENKLITKADFFVQNKQISFYCTIHDVEKNIYRYDKKCMRPLTRSATYLQNIIEKAIDEMPYFEVKWRPGMLVLLDNWRCLHARSIANNPGNPRVIYRALFNRG